MKNLKTVGIKELKNNLSAYLRDVRRGTRILVSDRNTIVAELREPLGETTLRESINIVLSDWVQAGLVTLPSAERTNITKSPLRLKSGISVELLNQERGETLD